MARLDLNSEKKLRKIPILITKWNDENVGWRAEIADNYEDYKPVKPNEVNFEDLSFLFEHNVDTHEDDHLLFYRKKDAVACAEYINKTYLNNKCKVWLYGESRLINSCHPVHDSAQAIEDKLEHLKLNEKESELVKILLRIEFDREKSAYIYSKEYYERIISISEKLGLEKEFIQDLKKDMT